MVRGYPRCNLMMWTYLIGFSASDATQFWWENAPHVMVFSNGTVIWHLSGRFETYCAVNMILFPFDTQVCEISVGIPVRPTMHINMSSAKNAENFSSNEVFEVGFKEPYVEYKYNEGIEFPFPGHSSTPPSLLRVKYLGASGAVVDDVVCAVCTARWFWWARVSAHHCLPGFECVSADPDWSCTHLLTPHTSLQ